ncbi:MAG: response regulator transcription factor [Bacteroidetes bacterium]|nr:response regulator transcription factor [Bacteroidota bacterium]
MIRAIIIDDELESRNTVNNILSQYCEYVSIVGQADGVGTGKELILSKQPELVFLDIQMADGTGFDLLEQLPKVEFRVIFVTAYDQYALKAIKYSALDYILKPIDPQQLIDAVNKFRVLESNFHIMAEQIKTLFGFKSGFEKIALPTAEGLRFVKVDNIIRCESDNNYTNFYLKTGEKILVTKTLKEFEEILSDIHFVRIHQSHLINLNFVERYIKGNGGSVIMSDGSEVEISRRRKEIFLEKMARN